MTPAEMSALSDQFRAFYQSYNEETKQFFLTVVQETFLIANRRNVELWVTENATRRNFINRSTSPGDLEMRKAFVEALTYGGPVVGPQKEAKFGNWPTRNGQKLREYLSNNYTRKNVTTIGFLNGQVIYTYDVYGDDVDTTPDESSDEFEDVFDE